MPETLKNQIANGLRSRLLANEWPAGTRLKEVELAKEFGVSRGPIRDVVLELTKEGFLRMTPNCGVSVAGFPESRARKVYVRARRDLEVLALRYGFCAWREATFERLEKILRYFKASAQAGDLPSVIEHDLAFHRLIISSYADEDLSMVWTPLMTTLALPYSRHTRLTESYEEHVTIIEALKNADLSGALELLKQHIQ